ncbi:MAG: hypothetical protein HKN10_12100 [Myxococcales bacterium]|nr:hypothetical protein [Myxococcales bacterium]
MALTETVQRFLRMLDEAIRESIAEARSLPTCTPYTDDSPLLFGIDSLAEGADQLVADAAIQGGFRFRLRVPVPFTSRQYKSFFSFDKQDSIAAFERITCAAELEPIVVELCGDVEGDRSEDYAAAADVLLDNCDLLLAVYDPSASGGEGGTAESVGKAAAMGLDVVGIDLRRPNELVLVSDRQSDPASSQLKPDMLRRLVSGVMVPPASAGLRRFLGEPLLAGSTLTRTLCLFASRVYGLFWSVIPSIGSLVSAVRSSPDRKGHQRPQLPNRADPDATAIINEVQRPYRDRRAPVDALARFYMRLYRGSFVMNFMTGALAVLFGLLSYFHHAYGSVWIGAEIAALGIIFGNFVCARVWDWHGRALDYRFVAEYLRHLTVLAPLGRSAPLVRPAAQYGGHDPIETWMGWYVRALDRDQGMVDIVSAQVPTVIRIDEAYVETMRARLCRSLLLGQIEYYRKVEERFDGAVAALRALMVLLFVVIAAGVIAHLVHVTIPMHPAAWREGAVLTIVVVALPAFLGALHGIAVQGELEKTADRAAQMSAYLEQVLEAMSQPVATSGGRASTLAVQAVAAARLMLGEVLDWRIIHQAHEVELT